MTGLTLTPEAVPWIVAAIVLAILLACLAVVVWRTTHTPRRRLLATVKAISSDALSDIVIPDGLDGQIHLDLVLLTVRGILVLDIKDHRGSVFAGANMEQWTVMDGPRRISVRNPLGALHDRVHGQTRHGRELQAPGPVGGGVGEGRPACPRSFEKISKNIHDETLEHESGRIQHGDAHY